MSHTHVIEILAVSGDYYGHANLIRHQSVVIFDGIRATVVG